MALRVNHTNKCAILTIFKTFLSVFFTSNLNLFPTNVSLCYYGVHCFTLHGKNVRLRHAIIPSSYEFHTYK